MIERIRAVHNPLTVIAIFAALAEIAGTVALAVVDAQYQGVFIWFVMLFPVCLVTCFFLTLNFNPKVLYAPSDFKNEENFLNILSGSYRVTSSLKSIDVDLENLRREVLAQIPKAIDSVREVDRKRLSDLIEKQLGSIRKQIEKTRESAESLSSGLNLEEHPKSNLQARILSLLTATDVPIESERIAKAIGMSKAATFRALERLAARGLVEGVGVRAQDQIFDKLCFQLPKGEKGKNIQSTDGADKQ